jgi:hypothetical protein
MAMELEIPQTFRADCSLADLARHTILLDNNPLGGILLNSILPTLDSTLLVSGISISVGITPRLFHHSSRIRYLNAPDYAVGNTSLLG